RRRSGCTTRTRPKPRAPQSLQAPETWLCAAVTAAAATSVCPSPSPGSNGPQTPAYASASNATPTSPASTASSKTSPPPSRNNAPSSAPDRKQPCNAAMADTWKAPTSCGCHTPGIRTTAGTTRCAPKPQTPAALAHDAESDTIAGVGNTTFHRWHTHEQRQHEREGPVAYGARE